MCALRGIWVAEDINSLKPAFHRVVGGPDSEIHGFVVIDSFVSGRGTGGVPRQPHRGARRLLPRARPEAGVRLLPRGRDPLQPDQRLDDKAQNLRENKKHWQQYSIPPDPSTARWN